MYFNGNCLCFKSAENEKYNHNKAWEHIIKFIKTVEMLWWKKPIQKKDDVGFITSELE